MKALRLEIEQVPKDREHFRLKVARWFRKRNIHFQMEMVLWKRIVGGGKVMMLYKGDSHRLRPSILSI